MLESNMKDSFSLTHDKVELLLTVICLQCFVFTAATRVVTDKKQSGIEFGRQRHRFLTSTDHTEDFVFSNWYI